MEIQYTKLEKIYTPLRFRTDQDMTRLKLDAFQTS